jgi:hypothetical protein
MEFNQREIAKFSEKDAKAYPSYEEHLSKLTAYDPSSSNPYPPLFITSSTPAHSSLVSSSPSGSLSPSSTLLLQAQVEDGESHSLRPLPSVRWHSGRGSWVVD